MASTTTTRTAYRKVCLLGVLSVTAAVGIAACGSGADDPAEPPRILAPPAGAYSGVFPCVDCPGIPTTVWLRNDGLYFLEQAYAAEGVRNTVASLGLWHWSVDSETLELRGEGPVRRFTHPNGNTLIMQTLSPQEHKLIRDRNRGHFDGTVALEGTIEPNRNGAVFTECVTQRRLPLSRGGDYSSFARQYRHLGAGNSPVFVAFEARFSWREAGTLETVVVDRFSSIRTDDRC